MGWVKGVPCRCDAGEDARRFAGSEVRSITKPSNSKSVTIQVAMLQMHRQFGIVMSLLCVVALFNDRPVRPEHDMGNQDRVAHIRHQTTHLNKQTRSDDLLYKPRTRPCLEIDPFERLLIFTTRGMDAVS